MDAGRHEHLWITEHQNTNPLLASGDMNAKAEAEHDPTVRTFTNWLAEMKVQNNRTVQEILSETSIIRDSITANNMELTDFKRHSSSISQQMQSQLTDLREKLTSAFGEITALVKQKTQSDSEMMQDVNTLQQNLSQKTYELEALKKSYSQAHQHLQSSLIQMQNHLQVTQNEVSTAKSSCERVQRESTQRFSQVESSLKSMTEDYSRGTGEVHKQMRQQLGAFESSIDVTSCLAMEPDQPDAGNPQARGSNWREWSGREDGSEQYKFGDLSRGVLQQVQAGMRDLKHKVADKALSLKEEHESKAAEYVRELVASDESQEGQHVVSVEESKATTTAERFWTRLCKDAHTDHCSEEPVPDPLSCGTLEVQVQRLGSPELLKADGKAARKPVLLLSLHGRRSGALREGCTATFEARKVQDRVRRAGQAPD
eukprot:s4866_g4.t1